MSVRMNAETFPRFELLHTNIAAVSEAAYVSFHVSLDLSFVFVFLLAHSTLPHWTTDWIFVPENRLGDQVVQF